MNKTRVIFMAAFQSQSGYGQRALELLRSMIRLKQDEWDFTLVSLRWGISPQRDLDLSDPINQFIVSKIASQQEALSKGLYDAAFFVTIPDELKGVKVAKHTTVFTAGIESTICSSTMLEGCNSVDLIVCSSQHGANVIKNTVYDQRDPQNNIVGKLQLNKPITTLFEATDVSIYDRANKQDFKLDIPEETAYLINGMWLPGAFTAPYGHDRKHISTTIKVFLETFKNVKNKPALILKVNCGSYSNMDLDYTRERIDEIRKTVQGDLPNIYLIHGVLTENELVGLYQHPKVKSLLTVSNEGWGRSVNEFLSATSKPIIAPSWGGMCDYIKPEFTLSVGGSLQPVHKSVANQFLLESAHMFYPDIKQLSQAMLELFNNYKEWEEKAKRQAHYVRTTFNTEKLTEALDVLLKSHIPEFPKTVQIKLPNLSAMKLPKLNKID